MRGDPHGVLSGTSAVATVECGRSLGPGGVIPGDAVSPGRSFQPPSPAIEPAGRETMPIDVLTAPGSVFRAALVRGPGGWYTRRPGVASGADRPCAISASPPRSSSTATATKLIT